MHPGAPRRPRPDAPLRRTALLLAAAALGAATMLGAWRWALAPHRIYVAQASVVFLAPVAKTENPFTYFPKTAQFVAESAALEVSSDSSRERLAHGKVEYDARLVDVGSQWVPIHDRPTVEVNVSGQDPDDVTAVRSLVVLELTRGADQVQASLGAPDGDRVTATSFGLDSPAYASGGRRSRALGMLLLLTGGGWFAFLRFLRRSARRTGPGEVGPEERQPQQLVAVGGAGEELGR